MQGVKKILIADDERINREMLKIIFGTKYEILDAENGEQAIRSIEQWGTEIDLILLDLIMPHKNGLEVLKYLKQKNLIADIPVIVITASNKVDDELRAYQCGAVDTIRKPFVPEVVLMKSQNLIELYAGRKNLTMQLEKRTAELMDTKKFDALTGLLNMKQFLAVAEETLQTFDEKECNEYAFVYVNIRNFKFFNVKYGIENGDSILQNLAMQIREISQGDLSARFGQDHFVTMTKNPNLTANIQKLTDDFEEEYGSIGMHIKTGVYRLDNGKEKPSTACEYAKIACDSIRNASEYICEYTEALGQKIDNSAYVIQHINEAIHKGYIKVYYQPVARTISGQICGLEALARWIDPKKGFMSPGEFIPVLEENRLITNLDLYVLRETCRGMKRMEAQGDPIVPVSLNLSRVDFEVCDIYSEVDKIVAEYGVAREMINIEVTESMIMNNPEMLKKEIQRFREGGYQVWMDDFGSGYSSLNVLKDYQFDEIKLDMKFMNSFDERSKEIVKAIILMAKKIGVQTLAEGVETQEQFEFLRYIGCEKVQGYYISRPIPPENLPKDSVLQSNRVEERAWKNYYNQIGTCNFITDKSLAIAEFDGKNITFRYVNEEFQKVLNSIGALNMQMVHRNMNSPTSPISRQFRELRKNCHVGNGVKQIIYSIRGQYIRLSAKCLAEHDNMGAFEIEIFNLTPSESQKKQVDKTYRMLYAFFDMVCRADLTTGNFDFMKQGDYVDLPEKEALQSAENFKIAIKRVAESLIYRKDQEAYLKFTDSTTLRQRLKEAGRGYVTDFFRTKIGNGAYVWKTHTILYVADMDSAIYCTRTVPVDSPDVVKRVSADLGIHQRDYTFEHFSKILHRGLMESKTVSIFWKDVNRRFLGANERFLQTYGFDSVADIIGKTDEDMQWHIEEDSFANDEWRVLKKGEIISHQVGRCIIRGVAHNIIASKEPLYDNGKIVGLVGYFVSADDLNESIDHLNSISVKDHITGLMSPQGLLNAVSVYVEEWQLRHKKFATIRVDIPQYDRVTRNFGEFVANDMLRDVADIIAGVVGNQGTCARLYLSKFVILMRYNDPTDIRKIAEQIQSKLNNVHSLAGYDTTLYPEVEISFADESKDMLSMIGLVTEGALLDMKKQESQRTDLNLIWNTYENINDNVYAADMDDYHLIYMNRHARESCGLTSIQQLEGKKCYELIQGRTSPCEFCNNRALVDGKPHEWEFFNPQFGSMFQIRDQMLIHNGQRIRIEHAVERVSKDTVSNSESNDNTMLLISECMRLALENSDPNLGLRNLLEYLGTTLSCERSYIFEMTDHKTWNNTYEWCAEGVSKEIDNLQNIPLESTELWNRALRRGDYVMIRDIEDTKENDPEVYAYLLPQNIHSLIVVPIYINHKLSGFAGLDNPPYKMFDEIVKQIRTISHVIETLLEKRNLMQNMDKLSYRDSLSNLGNRHAVERFFAHVDRDKSIGVAFCDVCGLKTVNDTFGHDAGDRLLLQICDLIKSVFADYHIFRLGGDEMLVLASGIDQAEFNDRCEKLRKLSVEKYAPLAVGAIWQKRILGILEDLIKESDTMMYKHKQELYRNFDIKNLLMNNPNLKD